MLPCKRRVKKKCFISQKNTTFLTHACTARCVRSCQVLSKNNFSAQNTSQQLHSSVHVPAAYSTTKHFHPSTTSRITLKVLNILEVSVILMHDLFDLAFIFSFRYILLLKRSERIKSCIKLFCFLEVFLFAHILLYMKRLVSKSKLACSKEIRTDQKVYSSILFLIIVNKLPHIRYPKFRIKIHLSVHLNVNHPHPFACCFLLTTTRTSLTLKPSLAPHASALARFRTIKL